MKKKKKKKKKKMAIHHKNQRAVEQDNTNDSFSLDALYCEEEERRWSEEEEVEAEYVIDSSRHQYAPSLLPNLLEDQDLFREDEELLCLFSKENEQQQTKPKTEYSVSRVRSEAVEWMLTAVADHNFSPLTAVLAINYLDRYLWSFHVQRDKPWITQLVAVTCLSLAAKVEEIHAPLLLDLQAGDVKFVLEAKTIQRMELLVLSTLKWKMHPVTPLSFLHHIISRLGLKFEVHSEFLRRCENLLVSAVSDSRSMGCLPSVLATATMMHVIEQVQPCNSIEYNNQLLRGLRMSKEKVDCCYQLIQEIIVSSNNKRKLGHYLESPVTVIDSFLSSSSDSHSSLKRARLFP